MQLTIYVVIAATIFFGFDALDSTILPFLYDNLPFLQALHERKPYIIDTVVLSLGVLIALYALSRVKKIERFLNFHLNRFSALYQVIAASAFADDTGLAFVDPDGKILSATKFFDNLAEKKRGKSIVGQHYFDTYSENLTRLLKELVAQALSTKTVAAVDIPDWSNYSNQATGPVVLYVSPSFEADEVKGFIIVARSTADVQNAVNSSIHYQMHYQILFDTSPIGVAVFRPSIASDGGVDGYIIEANAALKKAMEGITLPVTEPCSVVWPSFYQQPKLREAIAAAVTGGAPVRCEFFSPALGKHFEVVLAQLPGGRILCMVTDQTEARMNERKVLALNDQMQRTLAEQSEYVATVLDDIQHFNQATADMVETYLEELRQVIPTVPDGTAQVLTSISGGLYQNLNQMLRYHNVANLPCNEAVLLYPAEIVTRLLEPLGNRFPEISFEIGRLPGVVANREILTSILEQLMVSLAKLPVLDGAARIEIGSQGDFLSTNITVAGWGLDSGQVFIETPTERQNLDWTFTSDLDLATARRMVRKHGGDLYIGPTADGEGVELSFSIGSPPR